MKEEQKIPSRVLVVGGTGGLGRAVCMQLASQGLQPIIGWANAKATAHTIADETGGIPAMVDLRHPTESLESLRDILDGSALEGIVLSGALPPAIETFAKLDVPNLRERVEIDLFGSVTLLNPLVHQYMKPRRRGCVIGVLSEAMGTPEKASMPAMAGYVIGKYALAGVCAALAADNPWLKVRTISPGFMDTAMLAAFDVRFVAGLRHAGKIQPTEGTAATIVAALLDANA